MKKYLKLMYKLMIDQIKFQSYYHPAFQINKRKHSVKTRTDLINTNFIKEGTAMSQSRNKIFQKLKRKLFNIPKFETLFSGAVKWFHIIVDQQDCGGLSIIAA